MFKKFNWGHGIFLFYVVFVAAVLTALIASFGIDHSLVVDDYYAQDLAYQKTYDKMKNSMESDNVTIIFDKIAKKVNIQFPEDKDISGTVLFYRPSDKSQDFIMDLDGSSAAVSTKDMVTGKWKVKIDWSEDGKAFYKEKTIYI